MPSSIHDLGKISFPAEILSNPTKLTSLEFDMIKAHAQIGYDILKEIEFSWSIAEVVYPHNDQMDGSGVPTRFHGTDIQKRKL